MTLCGILSFVRFKIESNVERIQNWNIYTTFCLQQTSQNCLVSQWSDIQGQGQGSLSHSVPQIFKRSRSIITAQSGFGDHCPALVQNATILATGYDGNCAFLPCNNGICIQNSYVSMQATCSCAAGFFGRNCTRWGKYDPTLSDELWRSSHISVSSWSSCAPTLQLSNSPEWSLPF
jgi:hypothetical protein